MEHGEPGESKTFGWEHILSSTSGRSYYFNKKTLQRLADGRYLDGYGFKVYSQNDEDGILQEIFRRIGTTNREFVEFGVEDGLESNSHYLLLQGWKGLWIEADNASCRKIRYKFYHAIQSGMLKLANELVLAGNINRLIGEQGFHGEIDLLSVDIDSHDYYVLEAIDVVTPRVVVVEYNGKFPPPVDWVRTYDETRGWDGSDDMGASLVAYDNMMREKGYRLVGTNLNGTNAFFVREDLLKDSFPYEQTAEHLYNPSRYGREGPLYFGMGHPSSRFLGNRFGNGYRVEGRVQLNVLPADLSFVRSIRSRYLHPRIYIWGADECGELLLQVLQHENGNGLPGIVFCDDGKKGTFCGADVVGYAAMEQAYAREDTLVFLPSPNDFWERACWALTRNRIAEVYHILPLLECVETEDMDMEKLRTTYRRIYHADPFFAGIG